MYCVWQVVKTPTIISNNPVYIYIYIYVYRVFLFFFINNLRPNVLVNFNYAFYCLNRVQKRAAKVENNTSAWGWEILTQRRLIARICALFKAYGGRRVWNTIGDRFLKQWYLSREYHNRKIRARKQRTDVGKYSFVNRIIKNWNQLHANLLASFPCKLSTFRKRVKDVVTRKGIQVRGECK